jgi:hypothetical protein
MVVRHEVPFLQKEPDEHVSEDRHSKVLLSPHTLKTPSTPLSPGLTRQPSTQRTYSITATVTAADPAYCGLTAAKSISSGPSLQSAMAQAEAESAPATNSDPATQEFQGNIEVSTALPSKSTLEEIADLPVLGVDGQIVPFKSLYWSDTSEGKKVMIIFIRHFFCGVCIVLPFVDVHNND